MHINSKLAKDHTNPKYDSDLDAMIENAVVDALTNLASNDVFSTYPLKFGTDVENIPLDKVSLPAPVSSKYTTPSSASASSFYAELKDACESGWTYSEVDGNNVIAGTQPAADWYVEGSGSLKISAGGSQVSNGDYGKYTKDFDLTGLDTLKITVKSNGGGSKTDVEAEVIIGGTTEFTKETTTSWEQVIEIDVSGYSGITTVELVHENDYATPENMGTIWYDDLNFDGLPPANLYNEDTTTQWKPDSGDAAPIWCQVDIGSLMIIGAIRFYCGSSGVPSSVDVKVSGNGIDWETVESGFSPTGSLWNEVTFPARYIRYIRLIVNSVSDEIYEVQYWNRLTDRVASEHGHGV